MSEAFYQSEWENEGIYSQKDYDNWSTLQKENECERMRREMMD